MFHICISRYRRITVSHIIIGSLETTSAIGSVLFFAILSPSLKTICSCVYIYTHFLVRLISGEPLRFERERESKDPVDVPYGLKKTSSDRIAQPILRPWSTRHPAVLQCTTPVFAQKTVVCSWLVWGEKTRFGFFQWRNCKNLGGAL